MDECEGLTPALLGVQHRCGRRLEGVRSRDLWRDEKIPHVQGKTNASKTVGVARGHQKADTLKP